LADHLVRKGVVEDISHEGLRALLHEEGVSFQALKTWKESNDPNFEAKKNRILELYDLADGKAQPAPGDPDVVVRHLLAAYDLSTNRLYGHIKVKKGSTEFLAFLR
jgi:hypothetical protein